MPTWFKDRSKYAPGRTLPAPDWFAERTKGSTYLQKKEGEMSSDEEERAFERLRKEFPKSHVSLDKIRCSWRDKQVYQAYASGYGDKLYENRTMTSSDHLTADEAVDALIERREAEKKKRAEKEGWRGGYDPGKL